MICLRCGHCCKTYLVIIIDDPAKGVADDNLIAHEGQGPCKHLKGDEPGKYSCDIHGYPWYEETPCFQYGQIESENTECRMGRYILDEIRKQNDRKEKDLQI